MLGPVFRRLWKVVDLKDHRHAYNIMPIHVAITRRVRAGCESEFQQALREFFQKSFADGGVWGASMLTPPPGSDSREFGILRTFADERERDAFFPTAMMLNLTLGPAIKSWPFIFRNALFNACVVALLTWIVMPFVTRVLHDWLHSQPKDKVI
jgi:antibiotic biosynthesis monooxygenase (ABM) superfamily enzyme